MKFAIVDIETTGGNSKTNKITEIAIAIVENNQIIDTFESLINPHQKIPYFIQRLTGINDTMVKNAPSFHEVAKDIIKIMEGCVFVAHNVNFDYTFIKNEYLDLGYNFNKKKLCTVKLSRQYFPGINSYGLDNLIKHFKFSVNNRHRAMGDVEVTVKLFQKLFETKDFKQNIESHLYDGLTRQTIPKNINLEKLAILPESCGNFFIHGANNTVLFAQTTKNIKNSIIKLFRKPTMKFALQFDNIIDISYEETGNEIMGHILLDAILTKKTPLLNKNSNKFNFSYIITEETDLNGYFNFKWLRVNNRKLKDHNILSRLSTKKSALNLIDKISNSFNLCRTINNLEESKPCFNAQLKKCKGACINLEDPIIYNKRFNNAKSKLTTAFSNSFFIQDNGRQKGESCIYYFNNYKIVGFYWLDKNEQFNIVNILENLKYVQISQGLNIKLMSRIIGNPTEYLTINS